MKCEVNGAPESGLTVGALFSLDCTSEVPITLDANNLSLQLAKPDRFRLKILETKSIGGMEAHFIATSYTVGDNKVTGAVLSDGKVGLAIEPISFQVQSVLDPTEEPKAEPPFDPAFLMWPVWVFVAIAAVASVLFSVSVWIWRRRSRSRKFNSWLQSISTPMSPFDQMNRDLRRAARERKPLLQLELIETCFREYLCRTYRHDFRRASPRRAARLIQSSAGQRRGSTSHRSSADAARSAAKNAHLFFSEIERVKLALSEGRSDRQLDEREALAKTLPALHELLHDLSNEIESNHKKRKGRA